MTYQDVLNEKIAYYGDTLAAHDFAGEQMERERDGVLQILREIMRRISSATGEPTACRLDPDLMEQGKKLFEDEQV